MKCVLEAEYARKSDIVSYCNVPQNESLPHSVPFHKKTEYFFKSNFPY